MSDFQLHLASFLPGKDCSDKNVVENVHHGGRATTENIYQFHSNYADFTVQRNENQEKQQQQQQQQQQQKNKKQISKCILRSDKKIMLSATSG